MPAMVNTARSSGNILQIKRAVDLSPEAELLNKGLTPLIMLLDKLRVRPAIDPTVRWRNDQYVPNSALLDDASPSNTDPDTWAVDSAADPTTSGSYFNEGDTVLNSRTGEVMRVTAQTATTITVSRSWGSTAQTAPADNDQLVILGTAIPEGAAAPEMRSTVSVQVTDFVQDFRHSYQLTETLSRDMKLITSPEAVEIRSKRLDEHRINQEKQLFFGEGNEDLSNTDEPIRTSSGFRERITTTETDMGGTMTEAEFLTFIEDTHQRGGKSNKWLFAALRPGRVISGFGLSALRLRPAETTFGVAVHEYLSSMGDINIVTARLFTELHEAGIPFNIQNFGTWMFMIDMEKVWLRTLARTIRRDNIQNPSETRMRGEYVTKWGLEVRNERAHGIANNITG